jgi:hypothetical protein
LVRPYSSGTFTLKEAPSEAWRTNGLAHLPPSLQDFKLIVARNLANRAMHTYAEGGQVEPMLARIINDSCVFGRKLIPIKIQLLRLARTLSQIPESSG